MIQKYSKKTLGESQVSAHFKVKEFACGDGSDIVLIDSDLVNVLEVIRHYFDKPIIITSAYRTDTHNKKVGGSVNSQHVLGKAADIVIVGVSPKDIAAVAEYILDGKGGIGLYPSKGFVHIDTREICSRWVNYTGKDVVCSRFDTNGVVESKMAENNAVKMPMKVRPLSLTVDGKEVEVPSVLFEGHNYVKLREIAKVLGYNVVYGDGGISLESSTNTIYNAKTN